MKSSVFPVPALRFCARLVCGFAALFGMASQAVQAQGGPDIWYDSNFSLSGQFPQFGCALAVDPTGPHTSFTFRELTSRGSGIGYYFTTVSPVGGVHTHFSGSLSSTALNNVPYPVRVSRDGRNVAYIKHTNTLANSIRFSQNYGATFTNIPLPSAQPYVGPTFVINWNVSNSMVFGSDGKLYVFYVTTRVPTTGQPWNSHRLELLIVSPNGTTTWQSLATLSGTFAGVWGWPGQNGDRYLDVIATQNEVVALVSVGPTYQANGSAPSYANVPAAFVVDVATQSVQTISFGGALGGPNMATFVKTPASGETMLASDGTNLFMINYGLPDPVTNAPTYMIREFTNSPGKFARFFINTAAPGDQPYMDLESPALQFGTPLSIGNGVIYQLSAKWPVLTTPDHSVDVYGYAESQLQAGFDNLDVQRARIVNPNSGVAPIVPTILNDFSIQALAQIGITSSIIETGAGVSAFFQQRYSTNSVSDSVATTFCQSATWQGGPGLTFFLTDLS